MSLLDDLVARSRSPGRLVERRSFTLSREKAIEKQREFALRHPRQYVLELVQCAVFAGATYLAIDTRPSALLVAWVGGRPFEGKELEDLFDWLFADRGDLRWRHLVQLAIGVNALLQRRPRTLRIESGDGQRGVRLDLDAQGQATLGVPAEPVAGTYLYAEHGGWLERLSWGGATEERRLVEERCLYMPVPILLDGSAPFGYRGSRHIEIFGARAQETFDDGGRRGVVAVHGGAHAPRGFRVVVGGVWVSTLPLEPLGSVPLVGVVCDDRLRKTADQSDIVQDHRFVEMLHAVQPHATRLLRRLDGPSYRAPALPPIPRIEERTSERAPDLTTAEPLPDPIPSLPPRGPCTLDELRRADGLPVFRVAPEHVDRVAASLAPDVFPWRVLVLSDGQAATLAAELPELPVHRLTSKADVDFVARVVERGMRVRERDVLVGRRTVTLRLHLDGPLPDWGQGRPGVPFCVVAGERVVEHGAIDGTTVRLAGGAREPQRELRAPLALPRTSILVRTRARDPGFGDTDAEAVLQRGHALAAPDGEEPYPELLAALLAAVAVPQLAPDGRLGVSLPVGWPDRALDAPIVRSEAGRLSLAGLVALAGTDRVVTVPDLADLHALDAVERRIGYGHLSHPVLAGEAVLAVARFGSRWSVLRDASVAGAEQLAWVGATFAPREPLGFRTVQRPHPVLRGAIRDGATEAPWDEGWAALFDALRKVSVERAWAEHARPPVAIARAEALGRLAKLRLAVLLGREALPLLVPTDGGVPRPLDELRAHPAASVVARHGVRIAEPWTFALTCDEVAAVGPVRLRYDGGPEVWRSLAASAEGWLVRHEVHTGGLRGWLGLRFPWDGSAGVLLRTTSDLVALTDLERSLPCHGLLWPEEGRPIGPEQRRLAQLAGLRLYQSLSGVLARADGARADAARRHASTFVQLARRRTGRLTGTALDLAARIGVGPDPSGPEEAAGTALVPAGGDEALAARLRDALGPHAPVVSLASVPIGPWRDAFVVDEGASHRGRIVVRLNASHRLVAAAREPGPAREALLVALARLVCAWALDHGLGVDLTHAQQVLLAQRFVS